MSSESDVELRSLRGRRSLAPVRCALGACAAVVAAQWPAVSTARTSTITSSSLISSAHRSSSLSSRSGTARAGDVVTRGRGETREVGGWPRAEAAGPGRQESAEAPRAGAVRTGPQRKGAIDRAAARSPGRSPPRTAGPPGPVTRSAPSLTAWGTAVGNRSRATGQGSPVATTTAPLPRPDRSPSPRSTTPRRGPAPCAAWSSTVRGVGLFTGAAGPAGTIPAGQRSEPLLSAGPIGGERDARHCGEDDATVRCPLRRPAAAAPHHLFKEERHG